MIGESIGNFRIIRQLGKGGMGEVWLAEHKEIKTNVAIKLLLPHISADRQHVQRFFNEAVAVSKIKHSGIGKIFDVGFHARGEAYLVMEFLDGESLASRIHRSGRLPIGQLADVGRQIASVLEATHAEGITHRDLKPDNVFLVRDAEQTSGERVKVLDFGIAKLGGATMGLTGGAVSMGTPAYMSPEQWKSSAAVDGRADVYSLGCLVFEMACGRTPFAATSIAEACNQHLNTPPPSIRELVGELPPSFDHLLSRMLAKEPARRPTMIELKAAFSGLGNGLPGALDATVGDDVIALVPKRSSDAVGIAPTSAPPAHAGPGVNTTLGSSAATVARPESRRSRSRLRWLAVGATAIAGTLTVYMIARGKSDSTVAPPPAVDANPVNAFVRIDPPRYAPRVLGVASASDDVRGFRPSRNIRTPDAPYALLAHEVTWGELEPWLASRPRDLPEFPPWASDAKTRAQLPATGVTWSVALAYCQSIGATLPTEEQWEYAARGPSLRSNPWGEAPIDLARTHAYARPRAIPRAVKNSEQDQTPDRALYDLAGNVQEWTLDLWREDSPNQDESWVEDAKTQTTYRAIRGLPLDASPPSTMPTNSAAHREPLCASGVCLEKSRKALTLIGFRCARSVAPN